MPLNAPVPAQMIETLTSRIIEGRTLNPNEYRPVVIPLQVVLGASRQQGQASFNIPSTQRLIVRQFIPIVVPTNVSAVAETMTGASLLTTGNVVDNLFAKAQNCRIDLGLNSRMFNLFQQYSFPLSDLTFWGGGEANLKDMPGILVQGTTIDLTASLSDISAAAGDTQYGLAIAGVYVQVAQS
jgi:uncharacterized protein (DUF697 family)